MVRFLMSEVPLYSAGTQHAHRTLRTRLAWPVPLSEEEVPVLC